MTSMLLSISSAFILMIVIWSLLKIRDWQYQRHGWKIWVYEDAIFLFSLIITLTTHSILTGSDYTSILSTAPWTLVGVKMYASFWRKPK